MSNRIKIRNLCRKAHYYMSLAIGVLFALIALTGSLLVFYIEIDDFLNRKQMQQPKAENIVWETAYKSVRHEFPQKTGPWRFEIDGATNAIAARYYNPPETKGKDHAPMMVWLSSDGSKVIRQDFWGQYLMTFIYDLHYRLLMGENIGKILGYVSFGFLAILILGLVTWWPRKNYWAKSIEFKKNASKSRRLYDWHKLIGIFSSGFLILLVSTGIMLELPNETKSVLGIFFTNQEEKPAQKSKTMFGNRIRVDEAMKIAQNSNEKALIKWVEVPDENGAYKIRFKTPDDPSLRFPHSYIYIDQYTGEILGHIIHTNSSQTTKIMNWLHPLHDGSILGLPLRIIYVLIGFMPAFLFYTGIRRKLFSKISRKIR